jgi:gas vesicle protein
MAYVESVGLIVSLFCLPLLGFILGKHFTAARLTGEQNRAAELQSIHDLIEHNHEDVAEQVRSIYDQINQNADNNSRDVAEQVRSIYDEIKQNADDNSRAGGELWNKLEEVDKNLADAARPLYQTTTTAPNDFT